MTLMSVTLIFIRHLILVVLYLKYSITYYMESLTLILYTWKITLNIQFRTRVAKYFRSINRVLMFGCISVI